MAKELAQPIMDVAHPGKSAPSTTSKQIIITNRPIIKDPMMKADSVDLKPAAPPIDKLEPLSHAKTPPMPPERSAAAEPQAADPTATTSTSEPIAATSQAPDEVSQPGSADELTIVGATDQDFSTEKDDAAKLREQAIAELVEKETYFLPITSPEQTRARRITLLGIVTILILGSAWADIALDAGILRINGLHALTHFFSN